MKNVAYIVALFFVFSFTGCFDDNDAEPESPVAGFYSTGSFFISETGNTALPGDALLRTNATYVEAIIATTGEARFIFYNIWSETRGRILSPHFSGNVAITEDRFSAKLTAFVDQRVHEDQIILEGTFKEREGIGGVYTWGDDFGEFQLNYNDTYEIPSSLAKIQGIWYTDMVLPGAANFVATLTINSDGSVFGSDALGCVYNGHVDIIDSRFNVYRLSLNISSCGNLNGVYDGLATISESMLGDLPGTFLVFACTSDTHSFSIAPIWKTDGP